MRYTILVSAALASTAVIGSSGLTRTDTPPLSAIAFMSGCWTGPSSSGATIEERYSTTTDNVMIGMTRYVNNGRVVDFEFTTVVRTDSSFAMFPHPKGIKSDAFPLKELTADRAVFENLKHDFPQRVIYRRGANGSLIARIEGTTTKGERNSEWTMKRCG